MKKIGGPIFNSGQIWPDEKKDKYNAGRDLMLRTNWLQWTAISESLCTSQTLLPISQTNSRNDDNTSIVSRLQTRMVQGRENALLCLPNNEVHSYSSIISLSLLSGIVEKPLYGASRRPHLSIVHIRESNKAVFTQLRNML